jgi:hypothetical protein
MVRSLSDSAFSFNSLKVPFTSIASLPSLTKGLGSPVENGLCG